MTRLALATALLVFAGCASSPRLESQDFELVFERAGEARAAVTALGFDVDGALLVGSYRGELERIDDGRTSEVDQERDRPAEVLAIGLLGGEPVAVRRDGAPFQWGRLTGAIATQDGRFAGWSKLTRTLAIAGTRDDELGGLDVIAAAVAGERLLVLHGRPPAPSTLECRAWPSLLPRWRIELESAAQGVAGEERAGVLVVGAADGLEIRALEDGELRHRLAAPPSSPVPLRDGRRFALVQGEWLGVLDLGAAGAEPRVRSAFLAHRGGITATAVSRDGRQLATGGARGDVQLFRILPVSIPGASGVSP